MNARSRVALLLVLIVPVAAQAADDTREGSSTFGEWVYPGSSLLQEGRPAGDPPAAGTGQYTTKDSVQKVVRFYAKKAGLDPNTKPLDFDVPGEAGVVAVRTHDDAPSAMFLRNAGENTLSATLLYWTPGDTRKIAVSITRGKDDARTRVQVLLHQRKCAGREQQPELNNIPTSPSHWRNVPGRGVDSRVGRFESAELPFTIHYDIGELAGEYADTDAYPDYQWIKSGQLHGSSFRYLLNEDDTLYITFPNEGPANFWAKVAGESEINYVLELLARYRNDLLSS